MNKQTFSIEFSFDVDAGTIELLDDDKWCVNQLITPEVFIERYRNYKLDLMDKTHIDETAQQVLKIANDNIGSAFKENGGCVRDTRTEFTTEIDHVDIADIVYPGYTFWYDEYGNIGARCETLIAYTKNIIEHMFDSCTFDVTKTSYTSNIIVTPDGVARVFADVAIEFDGTNPRLQKSELGAEIEKRLQERYSEGLSGIADELIHINTFINIH